MREIDMSNHAVEVSLGKRFAFGKNWGRFLSVLDEDRILEAEKSLKEMLGFKDLSNKRFLDIGSGSGLFSLAARRLGATVHSFDFDPHSVKCTQTLKQRYFPEDPQWTIETGSILDADYIQSLGKFDVVYSWGVLHHTGAMWQALTHADIPLTGGGSLFISIYNDQSDISRLWRQVKRLYCSGLFGKTVTIALYFPYSFLVRFVVDLIRLKDPVRRYREHRKSRGMSVFIDEIDWLGGYPFEVAKPEQIFDFYREKGYQLQRLITSGGLGCNQYVFFKQS